MTITKILLAFCGIILGWMLVVPVFEFPDEQAHFATIDFLLTQGRLPVGQEYDLTDEMAQAEKLLGTFRNPLGQNRYTYHPEYRIEYTSSLVGKYENQIKSLNNSLDRSTYVGQEAARYPSLYYRFLGLFTSLVNQSDLLTRLFVTRLPGLFLILIFGNIVYKLGLEIFSDKKYALTLLFLTLFQPMMSFVTAGINSDNLHNLLFTAIILFSTRLLTKGLTLRNIISLALIFALDVYVKPQGMIALPLITLAVLFQVIRQRQWKLPLILAAVFLLALRLTRHEWSKYVGFAAVSNTNGLSLFEYIKFALNQLLTQNIVWYWGVFKWLGVVLPPLYWQVANRVVLLSAAGLLLYFFKVIKKKKILAPPIPVLYLILVVFIYALAIFWFDWQHVKSIGFSLGIQSRYFFPTLAPQMTLLLVGILSLGWSKNATEWLRKSLIVLFTWLQLGGLWWLITSYYDTASLNIFIVQVSQYKPFFAKGNWWYLWISLYLICLLYLLKNLLVVRTDRDSPR